MGGKTRAVLAVERWRMSASVLGVVLLCCCDQSTSGPAPPPGAEGALWFVSAPPTFGGIAADGERYYLGTDEHSLVAVNRKTRRIAWSTATGSPGDRFLSANVVIAAGSVVIGDFDLFAFDPGSGAPRWHYRPEIGFGPGVYGIATDGSTVYAGSGSGDVFAVNAATGSELWRAHLSDVAQTNVVEPVVHSGSIYVGYKIFSTNPITGGVAAIDAATGAIRWNRALSPLQPQYGSGTSDKPVVSAELVVVENADGRIVALDRIDGSVRWTTPRLPELEALNDLRPLVRVGSALIAGSTTGVLCAYDLATGTLRWKSLQPVGAIVFPLVADSRQVYVNDLTGNLLAVDAETGATKWLMGRRLDGTGGPFRTKPLVVGDTLIVPGYRAVYGILSRPATGQG